MAQESMWVGIRAQQVRLVARYWIRFSLRTGGGVVALVVVLVVGLAVAGVFIAPVEQLMAKSPSLGHSAQEGAASIKELAESDQFVNVVRGVTGADEDAARYLLQSNPALLSAIFLVLMWLFPFIACIGAFNQTAGDIGSRGLRYLLLRTERSNILLGRFLGTVGATALAMCLMFGVLILYVGFKLHVYPWSGLLLWGLQGYLAVLLLSLPYMALCSWISTFLDSAFSSLAICLIATLSPLILVATLDAVVVYDISWVIRLVPWGWKYDLLSADVGTRILGYGVMLAFTAVFLWLALRSFNRRDL